MWQEFKEFISKGNVFDLAIGVIIGAAFGKIVTSFVNDLLSPVLGKVLGGERGADDGRVEENAGSVKFEFGSSRICAQLSLRVIQPP